MAVILEIIQSTGVRTWQRLDSLPLTIGRSLANDVILDDPYVDARHARIALDDSGALRIEDLGSVNGLVMHEARVRSAIALQVGAEVRLGRTTLRFRDSDEAVEPALVDDHTGRLVAAANERYVPAAATTAAEGWPPTPLGRMLVSVAALGAVMLTTWLGTTDRSSFGTALAAASAYGAMVALWSGIWAVASRAVVHRFNFMRHFAMASVIALVALSWNTLESWLTFLFPDSIPIDTISFIIMVAVVGALIAGHLALSSRMPRPQRWQLGMLIAFGLVAIGGLAGIAAEDTFTDVPTFSAVLKPVAPSLIPTTTISEFGDAMADLKKEVDEMAEKARVSKQ